MAYSNSKSDCKSISSQKLLQERNRSKTQTETRKVSESDCKSLSPQNCSKKKKPIKKTPENKTKSLQIRLQNRFFREFLRQHKRWKTRTKTREAGLLVRALLSCGQKQNVFLGAETEGIEGGLRRCVFFGADTKGFKQGHACSLPLGNSVPHHNPRRWLLCCPRGIQIVFFFFHQNNLEI